ncbi:ANK3 [Symbiodinium sp. KB8]|nr:ANK3 [Symbiodinium sp. KB8]
MVLGRTFGTLVRALYPKGLSPKHLQGGAGRGRADFGQVKRKKEKSNPAPEGVESAEPAEIVVHRTFKEPAREGCRVHFWQRFWVTCGTTGIFVSEWHALRQRTRPDFYLFPQACIGGGFGASSPPTGSSAAPSEGLRQQVADEIGAYIRRCLSGNNRGSSGREKVNLANRIYVVARDSHDKVYDPVRVFNSWRDTQPLVTVGPGPGRQFGDSVFVGFPSQWEAKRAVAAAGLSWPANGPDLNYGLLAVRSTVTENASWVALLVVGEGESREIIVALPGKAWHRTQSRRLVPTSSFQLPRAASVRVVAPEDRETPLEELTVRLWIGRLSADWPRYVEIAVVGEADLELGAAFGDTLEDEHTDCIPFAPDLVEAAGDRISFQTAEELERGMTDMREGIREILNKLGEPKAWMRRWLGRRACRRATLRRWPTTPARPSGSGAGPLDETEEEDDIEEDEPAPGSDQDDGDRQTDFHCREPCCLEAPGHDTGGLAGRRQWSRRFWVGWGRPAQRGCFESSLSGPDRTPPRARRQHAGADGCRLWVGKERAGSRPCAGHGAGLGRDPRAHTATVRMAWILAGIVHSLAHAEHDESLARALVGLAAIEQLSLDRGSWTLAEPMLLEEPAPLSGRQMPTGSEQPFTRLLDARTIELLVYQVREVDEYLERRRRLGTRPGGPPRRPPPRRTRTTRKDHGGSEEPRGWRGKAKAKPKAKTAAGEAPPRVPGAEARPVLAAALWNSLPRWVLEQPTPFATFFRCLVTQKPKQEAPATGQAFPMPLPYPSVYKRSARRRTSRLRTAERHAVNLVVAVLSWLALDSPTAGPAWLSLGQPLSGEQRGAVRRLESSVRVLVRQPMVGPSEMGRVAAKVEAVENQLGRLETIARRLGRVCRHYTGTPDDMDYLGPRSEESDPSLRSSSSGRPLSGTVSCGWGSGSIGAPAATITTGASAGMSQTPVDAAFFLEDPAAEFADCLRLGGDAETVAKPLESHRLVLTGRPVFDPSPHLDPESRSHFLDPAAWMMDPSLLTEALPRPKFKATRAERLRVLQMLDDTDRLRFIPARLVDPRFTSGLFAIIKDQDRDRMIMDSRCPNAVELPTGRWIRTMATAASLLSLSLEPSEELVMAGEDGHPFYYAALNTLPMGDRNAVSYGQTAHVSLLLTNTDVLLEEMLTLDSRPPKISFATGICIDDFVCLEKRPRDSGPPSRTARVMRDMRQGYVTAGLERSEKKAFEAQTKASFWGAAVDGVSGDVRALPTRALSVMSYILEISRLGLATRALLDLVAGSLVAIFAFRRRLLSLLNLVYTEGRGLPRDLVFTLSAGLRDELTTAAILISTAATNLRARASPVLVASDASLEWEAGVENEVGPTMAREIARHALIKPLWNRLLRPGAARERAVGCLATEEELPADEIKAHPLWSKLARALQYGGAWRRPCRRGRHINISEVRAGLQAELHQARKRPRSRHNLAMDSQVALGALGKGRSSSQAINKELRRSLPAHLGYESYLDLMYYASAENPADDGTRNVPLRAPTEELPSWWPAALEGDFVGLDAWLAAGGYTKRGSQTLVAAAGFEDFARKGFLDLYSGSFGDLLEPGCQSKILALVEAGAFYYCVGGGPVCSSMSRAIRPPVRSAAHPTGLPDCRATMEDKVLAGNKHASFTASVVRAAAAQRSDFWIENPAASFLWLQPAWRQLLGDEDPPGRFFVLDCCRAPPDVDKGAESYPRPLNGVLAAAATEAMRPAGDRRHISACDICRCGTQRVGEAANPGPPIESLEEVQLVSIRTQALQRRILSDFDAWLVSRLSRPARLSLEGCAMAYCAVLRAYGNHLYKTGQPLYKWRHLCAFFQKERLSLRPYMPLCWDLATRWERVCPTAHRTPIPYALVRAIISLGLALGWARFAAVVGLAFYGTARVGEPLRAHRGAILLPCDLLVDEAPVCYVRVEAPKTGHRGAGKVQHFVVREAAFVRFLERLLARSPLEEKLFPASAGTFRRRWNYVLQRLGVPATFKLTPGGLRGGGAVLLYQRGTPVGDLLWRMRLRAQATLESYLQEVAAISVLPAFADATRRRIAAASSMYDVQLENQSDDAVPDWAHGSFAAIVLEYVASLNQRPEQPMIREHEFDTLAATLALCCDTALPGAPLGRASAQVQQRMYQVKELLYSHITTHFHANSEIRLPPRGASVATYFQTAAQLLMDIARLLWLDADFGHGSMVFLPEPREIFSAQIFAALYLAGAYESWELSFPEGDSAWQWEDTQAYSDVVAFMGARDMLAVLNIGLEDMLADCAAGEFAAGFKKTLAFQSRVIEQN